jgi:hypothetical protein
MKTKLLIAALSCAAALGAATPASAAILPGVAVDGPSADIEINVTPEIDVAPDGSAALVYLKKVSGVAHPYVSRFVNGAWAAGQRVDVGDNDPASQPRIAVANGGKVVVTYVSGAGGDSVARISPSTAAAFGAEHILQAGGDKANVDLSPNGNGYAAIEDNGNVFAERLQGSTWSEVGTGALDFDSGQEAGGNNKDLRVAASPDGAGGAIAWGEVLAAGGTEVFVRRLTGSTASAPLPTRLALGSLPNSIADSGKDAEQPAVDIDGAGRIWVVFRQSFEYVTAGSVKHRAIARSITGTTVGAGQVVDSMGTTPPEGRDFQQIDVNAAGQGLLSHHGNLTSGLQFATLAGGAWTTGGTVNPTANEVAPSGVPTMGGNGSGMFTYRFKDAVGVPTARARTTFGGLGAEITLSNPTFGQVVSGVSAATGSGAYAAAAFTQQSGGDANTNRVVAAVVDLPQPPVTNPPPPPPPEDTTDPDVTALSLARKRFRLGTALPTVAAVKTGTTIRFTVSEAATARLTFKRALPGRRVGGKCRKPTRRNRGRKRCTRWVTVRGAAISRPVEAGARRLRFSGRISRRRSLKPGRYELTLRARDAAGNVSSPDRAKFTLLPKASRKRRG